jgi:hypothetical protein
LKLVYGEEGSGFSEVLRFEGGKLVEVVEGDWG